MITAAKMAGFPQIGIHSRDRRSLIRREPTCFCNGACLTCHSASLEVLASFNSATFPESWAKSPFDCPSATMARAWSSSASRTAISLLIVSSFSVSPGISSASFNASLALTNAAYSAIPAASLTSFFAWATACSSPSPLFTVLYALTKLGSLSFKASVALTKASCPALISANLLQFDTVNFASSSPKAVVSRFNCSLSAAIISSLSESGVCCPSMEPATCAPMNIPKPSVKKPSNPCAWARMGLGAAWSV